MHNQQNHHHRFDMSPLLVGLLGVLAGAIIVAICHCIIVLCNGATRTQSTTTIFTNRRQNNSARGTVERSTAHVVVQSKYSKECKEDLCVVCLGEFKEGEGVRVLTECTHVFHVTCIDKWLENHSNCPLCRASTVAPSHFGGVSLPDSGGIPAGEMNRAPEFGVNVV